MDPEEVFKQVGFNATRSKLTNTEVEKKYYDDASFDSDADEEIEEENPNELVDAGAGSSTELAVSLRGKGKGTKAKQTIPNDDDLLYDPEADDDDETWLRNRIQAHRAKKSLQSLPPSDANLSCPCCLIPVCHDCQRHIKYETQFRAMFYENCVVDKSQVIRYPPEKKRGKARAHDDEDTDEIYWPVNCETCGTQVGVMDQEEVVHFFNVIAD